MLTNEKPIKVNRWFYALLLFHVTVWTFVPACVRYNLPLDALEGTTWGHQLQWGYDKDPFLNAWLTRLAIEIGGYSDWVIYFFSALSVAICFIALWQIAKKILPPLHAFVAVFMLEGMQYFHISSIDFDDNVLQLPLWALTSLYFYNANKNHKILDWILTGLFAGLAMMAKYYAIMLCVPLFLFLLRNEESRKSFATAGIYWGFLIFLLVIAPHTLWLFQHNFATLNYSVSRVQSSSTIWQHLSYPSHFVFNHLLAFSGSLVLFGTLFLGKRVSVDDRPQILKNFDKDFLIYVGVVPFLLTTLFSAIQGNPLHTLWSTPAVSLWGIILLTVTRPSITKAGFYRFITAIIMLISFLAIAYAVSLEQAGHKSSANYPGRDLASRVTILWHRHFHTPLRYIAGPRWEGGNVSYYSSDHPAVYIDWDSNASPWINEYSLNQEGAIFIWGSDDPIEPAIANIKKRFPRLKMLPMESFDWKRSLYSPPIYLKMGLLPPHS